MATHAPSFETHGPAKFAHGHGTSALRYVVPVGRVLFALIFVLSVGDLFSAGAVAHAAQHGVPLAQVAVPVAGILALLGGLSIALGYHARLGGWLLVIFLIPVTLYMHAFWAETDTAAIRMQQVNFMKNLALLGAALMVTYFGAGPVSVDEKHPG